MFTSADVGRQGRAYWGAYGVAGFGLEGLMQIFAEELAAWPNLRVNSIDPGNVRTTMRAKAYPGEDPNIHPLPEEIVASYLYLLGPASHGLTGRGWQAQRGNSAPLATV